MSSQVLRGRSEKLVLLQVTTVRAAGTFLRLHEGQTARAAESFQVGATPHRDALLGVRGTRCGHSAKSFVVRQSPAQRSGRDPMIVASGRAAILVVSSDFFPKDANSLASI